MGAPAHAVIRLILSGFPRKMDINKVEICIRVRDLFVIRDLIEPGCLAGLSNFPIPHLILCRIIKISPRTVPAPTVYELVSFHLAAERLSSLD